MTIVAGFSASRHGSAPLHLAAQLARTTGERIVAAAVVERSLPAGASPLEDEYQRVLADQTRRSLEKVVDGVRGNLDITTVIHESSSIPRGLMELAKQHHAERVVVGSSSSGLLGRIALGSVTERLVHTAEVAVVIAPRGYPSTPLPLQRITVGYGGNADTAELIRTGAELAKPWRVALRIASFTVRPTAMFHGAIERAAEDLVTWQWRQRTVQEARKQLDDVRSSIALPEIDVVVGTGTDWPDAVDDIAWRSGDLLLLGSGAAGPKAHVFLGSAASKILRHVPVPVMIVPRRQG